MGDIYRKDMKKKYISKLSELTEILPPFCSTFFNGRSDLEARTKAGYAYDLKVFFSFLLEKNPALKGKEIKDISLSDLEQMEVEDFDEYYQYLSSYTEADGIERTNTTTGTKRKMFAVRSLYSFLLSRNMINKNPVMNKKMEKDKFKKIIFMEDSEVEELINYIANGSGLTGRRQKRQENNRVRDLAIITLLLGTGIRISECVGIDLKDIDFERKEIHNIIRKGGNEDEIFFSDEVKEYLMEYLKERNKITPAIENEPAFFLSNRRTRMGVRSIEVMLKNYKEACSFSGKKITPHKLRSTLGTRVYRETGDIGLVAEILGHKDINTTKKHYADVNIERKRKAAETPLYNQQEKRNI